MLSQKRRLPVGVLLTLLVGCVLALAPGCKLDSPVTHEVVAPEVPDLSSPGQGVASPKITGDVEIVFKGGKGQDSTQTEAKRAFLSINAFEPSDGQAGHGSATYTVTNEIGEVHRQIVIELEGASVDPVNAKAWYRGVVVSDTKGCGGGPDGGHTTECPGDTAGCGEDDHDHTEGGCNSGGVDEGHDGGCSGHSGMGGSGGMGGPQVSGRNCRVGQYFVGKAHDGGTPGTNGDGITWKWFDAANPNVPVLGDLSTWSHLCGKTIIGGNIVVHTGIGRRAQTATD